MKLTAQRRYRLRSQTSAINLCLAGLLFLAVVIACSSGNRGDNSVNTRSKLVEVDKSDETQKGREKLIKDLKRKGLFRKIESWDGYHHDVRVWVGPAWYGLAFDSKQNFAAVVYGYYFDGTSNLDSVTIVDNMTGKEIGQYSAAYLGLKLNDQ
jgi:hypothetical protein